MKYKPIRIVPKSNEDWLKIKSGTIGASEATIACGLSPWKSPYELYLEKTGNKAPDDVNDSMILGKLYERPLTEFWALKTGHKPLKGTFRDIIYVHPDYSFVSCTPDVFFKHADTKEKWLLEVKNPDNRRLDQPEDTWIIQLNYQMGICGIKKGALLWSYPQRGVYFMYQEFDFNQELFDSVLSCIVEFWTEHVEKRIEPDMIRGSDALYKYPVEEDGKVLEASESLAERWNEAKAVQEIIRTKTKELDQHKDYFQLAMLDAEKVKYIGQTLCTWKANKNGSRVFRFC